MKKQLTIIGIAVASLSNAQWSGSSLSGDSYRTGYVGIGYSSAPSLTGLLTVNAIAGDGINILKGTHNGYALAVHDNTGGRFAIWNNGGISVGSTAYGNARLNVSISSTGGNAAAFDLYNTTQSALKFRIYDNGATIIGDQTNSNGALLSVNSQGAAGINLVTDNNTGYAMAVHNTQTSPQGVFGIWRDGRVTIGNTGANNSSKLNVNVTSAAQSAIEVYNSTTATMQFQVKGDGRVYCRELTVTAAYLPFPDYVFAKDYKLKTMRELDQYIQQNKRLPGFESAEYYEKNGLKTAEMLIKQQEKIEELTLYLLEQNKLNEKQQEKIEVLQSEMENLKNRK